MKEEDLKNMLLDLTVEMVKDPYACVSDYLFALGKLYEIMMSDIGARREAIRLIEEFLEGRKSGKNWQGFSGLVFDLSEVLRRIRKEEEERERKRKREKRVLWAFCQNLLEKWQNSLALLTTLIGCCGVLIFCGCCTTLMRQKTKKQGRKQW